MLVITFFGMYRSNRFSNAQRVYDSTSSFTWLDPRDVGLYDPVYEPVEKDIFYDARGQKR